MSIRLWPQDYERKEHINKAERALLRNASRNFSSGHIAVSIDPVGMSTNEIKMGMYISPTEGLITFSINAGPILSAHIEAYVSYVQMIEKKIYERLIDSKMLIVRNGEYKTLKFPYKHIMMFPDVKPGKTGVLDSQLQSLQHYATIDFFRPITSKGKEISVKQLGIFDGIRMPYDKSFSELSEKDCQAIFERLAPEYTVIMTEIEDVKIDSRNTIVTDKSRLITGKEMEYKTFFLDEYQVSQVNDMGTGHRVILANPGAGKSVLLLSKAFKYASLYKESKVLLTCYNNNLSDSYNFKRSCADFGDNKNLFIMTFHKLVKKIYEECLHTKCETNIVSDDEIKRCIELIKRGQVDLRFKAIFIDEVQNFDPLYLELCYLLLDSSEDQTFLMAGDLNQSVRAQSRRGDVPWKRIHNVKLDFNGRVKYIEKNYRNSKEIGEYIFGMLKLMNDRFSMLGMINSLEYEYNSFTLGDKNTIALKVKTGIDRLQIKNEVISALKEIVRKYKVSYSDVAILFPYRKMSYLKYYFLYWLEEALKEEDIPYSLIINTDDNPYGKTKYSNTKGVVLTTIESSLGLDFKAVILAGLLPYDYVFQEDTKPKRAETWQEIKEMTDAEQNIIQSQMRSIYTACSRARDILYVLSDLKSNSPMEEILKKNITVVSGRQQNIKNSNSTTRENILKRRSKKKDEKSVAVKEINKSIDTVVNHVTVKATILETGKRTTIIVDVEKYAQQNKMLGKKIGDTFSFAGSQNANKTYRIEEIVEMRK